MRTLDRRGRGHDEEEEEAEDDDPKALISFLSHSSVSFNLSLADSELLRDGDDFLSDDDDDDEDQEAWPPFHARLDNDRYGVISVLGSGSFGRVVLAADTLAGSCVAIKALDKAKASPRAKAEVELLKLVHSPFVVRSLGVFETPRATCQVLSFCQGGDMHTLLDTVGGRMRQDQAVFYAAEVLLALEALHAQTIAFRDLKPENVMLDADGHVVLVDLGLAKRGVSLLRGSDSLVGTPEYLAPEVLLHRPAGLLVDVWALGMLLHELVMGLPPWYVANPKEVMRRIVEEPLDLGSSPRLSHAARTSLTAMLTKDPHRRLGSRSLVTTAGARACRSADVFRYVDWDRAEARALPPPFPRPVRSAWDTAWFAPEFVSVSVDADAWFHSPTPVSESPLAQAPYRVAVT